MRGPGRAQLVAAWTRDLVELTALLTGDPETAGGTAERAQTRVLARSWARDPEALLTAARRAVLAESRRAAGPWTRRDPLAALEHEDREVLALRVLTGASVPAVAHLLDTPFGTVVARERAALAALRLRDLDAARQALRRWLDDVPLPDVPAAPAPPGLLRSAAGLAAVAVLAAGGLLLAGAVPAPGPPPVSARQVFQPDPRPARPTPTASGCAREDALCAPTEERVVLPPAEGVDTRTGTPFWPFTTDREAADWAVDRTARPWAADPVQVAQRLADDVLQLPGLTARAVGGGLVALREGDRTVGTVRLVRLGPGEVRPWTVVQVRSPGVALSAPGPVQGGAPLRVAGKADGPVDVRLVAPDGRVLGTAAGLGQPLTPEGAWTVAALVARRTDGSGLAVEPVRRSGTVDDGVPAPGSTFVSLVNGSVRLHDGLTGEMVLQVSAPTAGARDSDPSRGGRDGVLFVRTEADGCTTSVLRAALDRGAGGTTVQRRPVVRRLPRLSPDGRWLAHLEAPCTGGAAVLVLRGPDARARSVPLGTRAVSRLDVADDGSAVLQLRGPDRTVLLPPGAPALVPALPARAGCRNTAAAAAGTRVLVWERCGATATPVLLGRDGSRQELGAPARPVLESAVVQAPDGPLVLARTDDGAVSRLVGRRLVPVVPPCRNAPGCVLSPDW